MEFNIENLQKCKTITECSKLLGYSYYNATVKEKLIQACESIGFDLWSHLENINKNKQKLCLNCGKPLNRRQHKFCCSSCSATYNNKNRKHSAETKEKIRKSTIKYQQEHPEVFAKFINAGIQSNLNKAKDFDIAFSHLGQSKQKICPVCHKEFTARAYSTKYCSKECVNKSTEVKEILRQKQLERVKQGIHSGWQSRNITSYPEQFWINVLKNNNISFEREKHVGKYFLDFVISINDKLIDLEIDGKQHKYQDRLESDCIRDKFLKSEGYIIYRIDWNEINSDKGKKSMKNKINKFIDFISSL